MYGTMLLHQKYENKHDLILNFGSTSDEVQSPQKMSRPTAYAKETLLLSHWQQWGRETCCQFRHPHPARRTPKQPQETLQLQRDPEAYFWEIYSNTAVTV